MNSQDVMSQTLLSVNPNKHQVEVNGLCLKNI